MSLVLAACLLCVQPCADVPPVDELAEIVAGEVSVVPEARMAVACTALADWEEGVSLSRWYGRAAPGPEDYRAVALALAGDCPYPRFRFVGNADDWHVWQALGLVHGEPTWTWTRGDWVVVAAEDLSPSVPGDSGCHRPLFPGFVMD